MKIPTSSSIILTTLAVSSSSSCLIAAAPFRSDTGMTSSSSNNQVPAFCDAAAYQTELDLRGKSETVLAHIISYTGHVEKRNSLVNSLVDLVRKIPLAGEALSKILTSLVSARGPTDAKSLDVDGTIPKIDPRDMQALENAIGELAHAVNSTAYNDVVLNDEHGPSSETSGNVAAKSGASTGSASSPASEPFNPPNSPID